MQILIGILVIVVAVFLNSVELGTPLGAGFPFRPGAAPTPVPVPVSSARRPTGRGGRGGRHGRQQSERTSLPAVASEPVQSTSEANQDVNLGLIHQDIPRGTYIEDPRRGFIKIEKDRNVVLCRFENVLVGRIEGEDILPIFNKRHEILRIDYNQNGLRIPMNETEAQRWGVFEKWAKFRKTVPPAFL